MRSPLRVAAAVVLTAAAGTTLTTSPAAAAACSTASGVTVVVDFHELGGGLHQVCDPGSGQNGAARFADAGFDLDRVQNQPGFVCRVDGAPADDPCVNTPPADAYWGLWWSDGTSGSWTYSSQGVDSLKVPDGGSIALSWKGSSETSPPGVAPGTPDPAPSQSPSPTASPSSPGGGSGSDGAGSGSGSGAGSGTWSGTGSGTGSGDGGGAPGSAGSSSSPSSASASGGIRPTDGKRQRRARRGPNSATPEAGSTTSESAAETPGSVPEPTDAVAANDGALPVWVAPAGIAALFVAAATTAVVRRRRGSQSP